MAIATPNNTVSKNNQALFERGFKAWCENTSLSMRIKLGIGSHEPLDALILAERLGVHILPLDQVDHLPPETIDHLSSPTDSEWSAVTVSLGKTCVVVTNPSHTPGRTSSDLMHELAHIVLNHIPGESFFTHDLMMHIGRAHV